MSDEFGRYRLEDKIGEGALAEVYRVVTPDGTPAALKRLARAHLNSAELIEVFAHEARIAAQITDPRLLGAIDCGHVEGWPYLVMALASKGSLAERITEGSGLGRQVLGPLAVELGHALTALHGHGFVHGDLSPSNILFGPEGQTLLSDFSASTEIGTSQSKPRGTFAYMSPEQVRGQALDAKADIFSLAVLLWECASGQRIFWREAQHLCFMAVVEADPPEMPAEMAAAEAVLRGALAKDAKGRPDSVQDVCAAFAAAL